MYFKHFYSFLCHVRFKEGKVGSSDRQNNGPVVVKASKDKKKVNVKVNSSIYFLTAWLHFVIFTVRNLHIFETIGILIELAKVICFQKLAFHAIYWSRSYAWSFLMYYRLIQSRKVMCDRSGMNVEIKNMCSTLYL